MQKCYCGSENFSELYTRDYLYKGENAFVYDVCTNCGSYYLKINDLKTNNYDVNYYSIQYTKQSIPNAIRSLRYTSNSGLSKIIKLFKPISVYNSIVANYLLENNPILLDFGSGSSNYINFLRSIKLISNPAYSYDPYSKDETTLTNFEDIPFHELDLIISNHAIEHLEDPQEIIMNLYDLSKDSCEFIFSVPIVGSVLSHYKEFSFTLQAPDHITILSLHSWIKLLTDTKWKVISITEDKKSQLQYICKSNDIIKRYKPDFIKLNPKKKNREVDNIVFYLRK